MKPLLIFPVLLFAIAFAAPMPYEIIVNNATMECAEFWGGDECYYCTIPSGWTSIGYSWNTSCPSGYTKVDYNFSCAPAKDSFCCTEFHSGMGGDCGDMVMNDKTKECAFVDDISNCTALPSGWKKRPASASLYSWLCPMDYDWSYVNCTGSAAPMNATGNATGKKDTGKTTGACASAFLILSLFAFVKK